MNRLAMSFLCLLLAACGGGSGDDGNPPPPAATLQSIAVSPASQTVLYAAAPNPATTQQFTATGTYSDSSTRNLTAEVTWTSGSTAVATINSQGLATVVGVGTTSIQAASGSVTGSVSLTANRQLVSIAVTSALTSLAPGTKQPYTATATYNDTTTADVTTTATWSSSLAGVATVSDTIATRGLVSAVAAGSATITAQIGSISGTAPVTVSTAALVAVQVTPASSTLGIGTSTRFFATGTFNDSSTQDISNVATWTSSNANIASSTSNGFFTGAGLGTADITATWQGISNQAMVNVDTSSVLSIVVTPASATVAQGTTQPFRALLTLASGGVVDVSAAVGQNWSSSNPAVATVASTTNSASGRATGVSPGTATIQFQLGSSAPAQASLTVSSAAIQSIAVSPADSTLQIGTSRAFSALGTFSGGLTQDITADATWTSSNTSIAQRLSGSTFAAVTAGTVTITAAFGGSTGTTSLTSNDGPTAITISPSSATINALSPNNGATLSARDAGTGATLSNSTVTWSSSDTGIATVASNGRVTAVATGSATITATSGSASATAVVTVQASPLVSLAVTPTSATIANGATRQFSVTGTFADGSTDTQLRNFVNWTSSSPGVATVSNVAGSFGLAQGLSPGTTQIGAQYNAVTSSPATLTVQ